MAAGYALVHLGLLRDPTDLPPPRDSWPDGADDYSADLFGPPAETRLYYDFDRPYEGEAEWGEEGELAEEGARLDENLDDDYMAEVCVFFAEVDCPVYGCRTGSVLQSGALKPYFRHGFYKMLKIYRTRFC